MLVPGTPFFTLDTRRSRVFVFMKAALVRSRGAGSM
jgi:hypothetical protein